MEGINKRATLYDTHHMFIRVDIKEEKCWSEATASESADQLVAGNCLQETIYSSSEPATGIKCNDVLNDEIEAHIKTKLEPGTFCSERTEEKPQITVSQVQVKTEIQGTIQHLDPSHGSGRELKWSFEKSSLNAVSATKDELETTEDCSDSKAKTSYDVFENVIEEKECREETAILPDFEQPYKCEVCSNIFPSAALLDKHCRAAHNDGRKFKCEICDRSFKWNSCLKSHLLLHEGKSPYRCHLCEKSFTRISHLKTHILTHEGKRPHKCNICDRSFTESSNLKKHYLIHEGKRPYKCDVCEKSFTQMVHLKVHNMIHEDIKPHKCKICDKSFVCMSYLKRHNKIHERPHKCDKCHKCFTEVAYLNQHALIHDEKRPHKCKVCGNSFKRMWHLRKHNLTHKNMKTPENEICKEKCLDVSE